MKKWDYLEEENLMEQENSKVKDFLTKGLPKKAAIIGLSAAIALGSLAFGGCEKEKPGEGGISNQGNPSQIEQTEEKPNEDDVIKNPIVEVPGGQTTPGGTTNEKEEIPVEQVEEIVEKLRNNFSCVMHIGRAMTTYEVSENLVMVEVYDQPKIFYQSDEQGNYVYTHKGEGVWEKNFAQEQYNADPILYDKMCRIDWTSYEKEDNKFFGRLDGKDMQLILRDKSSFHLSCDEWTANVYSIGDTEVLLPENIVDKTVPQQYVCENGDYNIVLLKEVMEDWMKGNNQWNRDVLAQKSGRDAYKTQEIIFVRPSKEKLEFGLIMNRAEDVFYYKCYLEDQKILSKFESGNVTKEEMQEYLNSILPKTLKLDADQPQIDSTITQAEFEKMTKNVFKKLTNKGVQNGGVNVDAPSTKLPNFDKAEILYGFKGMPIGSEYADATLGYKKGWHQYYIVEYNGNLELIELEIISSTYNSVKDENQNVINDTDGWWYISTISREELDKENTDIFANAEIQSVSTAEYAEKKVEEKNKELL